MNRNWGTLVLAILASITILLLRLQGTTVPTWLMVETISVISAAIALRVWMNRRTSNSQPFAPSSRLWTGRMIVGAGIVLVPWLSKLIQTQFLGENGEATELMWIGMLQYAGLWCAAGAYQSRHEWLSFLISCFLAIFGLATSDRDWMIQIVGPFAIIAAWWLMARYWNSIEGGFVASENIPLFRMRLMILLGIASMAAAVLVLATTIGRETVLLDGFMPTSGGRHGTDPSARQGVGDGEMLVAAREEAHTFGAVDSDLFLDSEMPSMYDLVSEIYGEPSSKTRKLNRAVSLDQQIKDINHEGTESKKNSREFSALRKPKNGSISFRPQETESPAVVQWIGRTPAWLRLETFDRFEQATWIQSPTLDLSKRNMEPELKPFEDKPWMLVQSMQSELVYPVRERSAIKVIHLESPRILTPSLITHVHIDRIDQPDFFGWMHDGQLMMPNREHVPRLTVVHQMTQIPALHPLRDPANSLSQLSHTQAAHSNPTGMLDHYLQIDEPEREGVSQGRVWLAAKGLQGGTAGSWSKPATDWDKVMGVVQALRSRIELDATAVPPEDCEAVVPFVLREGRAPDYLIATTAVLMIRDLGIPCRLCRGFLAKPERFDHRSRQTEVLPEDLHTWAEVFAHGMWIPIEPTGAYPMPYEHRTWQQWAIQMVWSIRDEIVHHPFRAATILGLIALATYLRQRLLEFTISVSCGMIQWLPVRARIRWVLGSIRWRMWLWGEPLARSSTIECWLTEQLAIRSRASRTDAEDFVRTVQGLAYAPVSVQQRNLAIHGRAINRVCWSLVVSGIMGLLAPRRSISSRSSSSQPLNRASS